MPDTGDTAENEIHKILSSYSIYLWGKTQTAIDTGLPEP